MKQGGKSDWILWLLALPLVWWAALLLADCAGPGRNLMVILELLTEKLNHPFQIHFTEYTVKSLLLCTLLYGMGIGIFYSNQKNYRREEEHGSARWGNVNQLCKKYRAIPNIMQCNCSMVITDPKAELLRKTGGLLKKMEYEVRVFDLIHPDTSFCYNPFQYVQDDKDVLRLINNLIKNTTPKGSQSSDPFWEKSETALLQALMMYLLHEAPPEEQNFPMIMEMLASAQVKEDKKVNALCVTQACPYLEQQNQKKRAVIPKITVRFL